jgi:hypothetical protein
VTAFPNGGVDPFSFYYGYYLPHQAAIAAQPRPMDTLNAITAERQMNAATDRAGLYDPISPYAQEDEDQLGQYGRSRRGRERLANPPAFQTNPSALSPAGRGSPMYYNRTARYFPQIRVGQGPNRNLAVHRQARGGYGGGMPSMPSMSPGLR